MSTGSTQRLGLDPAPGGLGLVQDLVNTSLANEPELATDLLATLDGAQTWLGAALAAWSSATRRAAPKIILTDSDLEPLHTLREHTRDALRHGGSTSTHAPPARIELELDPGGLVGYHPTGTGWKALAAMIYCELLIAQATGTRERLKTCEKPSCRAAFYDQSRNGSRVWHDTKMCGNAINLRASRARRATNQQ